MMAGNCWSIKRDLNNIEHDNQKKGKNYHCSYVCEGFISAVNLLYHLMKILVGIGVYSIVIFLKTCYCKKSISQQADQYSWV